jgi:hypothetical protein
MNLPDVRGVVSVGKSFIKANRPEILLGASVAATAISVVSAAIGGYRSGRHVESIERDRAEQQAAYERGEAVEPIGEVKPLTKTEIFQETWQNYVPAAGASVAAVASTFGLHVVHIQDKKALVATALAAVEEVRETARAYIEDLNEAVDENATDKAKEKIKAAHLEKSAARGNGIVHGIDPVSGVLFEQYLVRDGKSGQTVYSNQHEVEQALLRLNEELQQDGEVGLETFMSELGYEPSDDQESYGWSGHEKVRLHWDTTRTGDGRPVCVFSFDPAPRVGYDKSR